IRQQKSMESDSIDITAGRSWAPSAYGLAQDFGMECLVRIFLASAGIKKEADMQERIPAAVRMRVMDAFIGF
ncbi:MAG: hypothetical protein K2H71_05275, partial [Muribaculaceae bacterium]|nr:hypothetical protein [Muribaculaceae bacterium]